MILNVDGIDFAYESKPILEDVTFSVERGELLGIIGPNGSGKSTLLKCLNRLLEPDDGSIYVNGEDLESLSRNDVARQIGYVPQSETRMFSSTVYDALLLGRKPHVNWRASDQDHAIIEQIIERLGLEPLAMRPLDELSGGQRQRVLIGRALAQEASVLLLDEPTSSLDVRHQLEVLALVAAQIEEGMAGVLAIHDLNLAVQYCDSLALLCDNQIVAVGSPDILTTALIRDVYGVEATVTEHEGRPLIIPERPL